MSQFSPNGRTDTQGKHKTRQLQIRKLQLQSSEFVSQLTNHPELGQNARLAHASHLCLCFHLRQQQRYVLFVYAVHD